MSKMLIKNVQVKSGRIDFKCVFLENMEESSEYDIYFELSNVGEYCPNKDLIAIAAATLAGTAYDEIEYDMTISQQTKENIEKFTNAKVIVPKLEQNSLEAFGNNVILNFSGGFDSLAAMYLMPQDTKLVAMDFGGWFARESVFFDRFYPYVVKTNFRQLKLDRRTWTFMGVGAILYSEYLKAGYNVFGTILEATGSHFQPGPSAAIQNWTAPFCYAGLKDIRYTNGLTEVGTAIVVSHYAPEILNDSLISLSMPKTEKRYRKELLLEIICDKFHRKVTFDRTEAPNGKIAWGKSLAVDFLALYIMKNRGRTAAEVTVSEIPHEVDELIENMQLCFYERLNCEFISGNTFRTDEDRGEYMKKLLQAGVVPYTEKDYEEFRTVADFLNRFYHIYPVKENHDRKNGIMFFLKILMQH